MAESTELVGLADLGTNGEIVVGDRSGLICASTAAGPAFEAGRIRMGMRASAGAITGVSLRNGKLHCHVLGEGQARGICGSGLVDAAAAGLNLGFLQSGASVMDRGMGQSSREPESGRHRATAGKARSPGPGYCWIDLEKTQ
jgi:uncharacterized 2Fe-2S/4Fe-4S cluster protein (DUF4445 family)